VFTKHKQELCAPLIYLLILSYKLQNLKLTKSINRLLRTNKRSQASIKQKQNQYLAKNKNYSIAAQYAVSIIIWGPSDWNIICPVGIGRRIKNPGCVCLSG